MLQRCDELRAETRGYFDMHAASAFAADPSGFVKGWSIDRAAALLQESGVRNFAINAGGDVRLSGRAVPQLHWRVGIQHPLERGEIAVVVEANELAIATSGAYERGAHVLDPHTGRPPSGVLSVVFGLLLFIFPGAGALTVVWLIGIYALVFGFLLLGLAWRLRGLRQHGDARLRHVGRLQHR